MLIRKSDAGDASLESFRDDENGTPKRTSGLSTTHSRRYRLASYESKTANAYIRMCKKIHLFDIREHISHRTTG